MDDFDWLTTLKLAATTGVLTTILNQGVNWFRDWRRDEKQRSTQAAYLALQLSVIFESYTSSCVYRSWHDADDLKQAHELGYNLPELAEFPDDSLDWKSFYLKCPKLAGQAMAFPNEIRCAEISCQFQGMREGNPFASADETVVAGIKAWKLAQALRQHFGLEAVSVSHVDSLESNYKKLQERTEFKKSFAHYAGLQDI